MNITEIAGMSNIELDTLLNAIIEEKAHRKESQKTELWNEFCAIYNKIHEEGFDIDYCDEYFNINDINIY